MKQIQMPLSCCVIFLEENKPSRIILYNFNQKPAWLRMNSHAGYMPANPYPDIVYTRIPAAPRIARRRSGNSSKLGMSGLSAIICGVLLKRKPAELARIMPKSL